MSDFNFEDFKDARKDMVQEKEISSGGDNGDEGRFVSHELKAVFSIDEIFAAVSENPTSKYEGHPFHFFKLRIEEILRQEDHEPYHPKELQDDEFSPTPVKPFKQGDLVNAFLPLPRVQQNLTKDDKKLLNKNLDYWAALFQVQPALVDLADAQEIADEDGRAVEGRYIGVNYSLYEYDFEDSKTGENIFGAKVVDHPYPVDQDTLERVDLRGAFDVAEQMVEQCQAGPVEVEKVAEMLDYLIEIEEMPESDAEEFMAKVT